MNILTEIDFYTKYLDLKKEKGFGWKTYGSLIGRTDATIRMAFQNKSLKDYEMEIIENYFDSNKSSDVPSPNVISLDSGLLKREKELDMLGRWIAKFKPELEEDAVFKLVFKELRLEGENMLLRRMIEALKNDNSQVAQNIKEFLLTQKVTSGDN